MIKALAQIQLNLIKRLKDNAVINAADVTYIKTTNVDLSKFRFYKET